MYMYVRYVYVLQQVFSSNCMNRIMFWVWVSVFGDVWVWGGGLGCGWENGDLLTPQRKVMPHSNITQVAAGRSHSAVLTGLQKITIM